MLRESLTRYLKPSICSSCRLGVHSRLPTRPIGLSVQRHQTSSSTHPPTMRGQADAPSHRSTRKNASISPNLSNPDEPSSPLFQAMANPERWRTMAMEITLPEEPHHLHVYSHRHNTHVTLTRPTRDPILSLSTGNLGFRKSQRGSWDAAFQLVAKVLRTMVEKGLLDARQRHKDYIEKIELVFRGFGQGRDAFFKALMGMEGRGLRKKVVKISDSTRLKFGGPRGKKPRRL